MTIEDKVREVLRLTQCGESRAPRNSDMRAIIAMLLTEAGYSQIEIGDMVGRERSSVYAMLKRYNSYIGVDEAFRRRDKAVRRIWASIDSGEESDE